MGRLGVTSLQLLEGGQLLALLPGRQLRKPVREIADGQADRWRAAARSSGLTSTRTGMASFCQRL